MRVNTYSNITLALFRQLNFAADAKGKIPVEAGKYTPITSGYVPPSQLYSQVLENRKIYHTQIEALRQAGLEDPFEEIPEIRANVKELFERFKPRTQLTKAILLFLKMIPANVQFSAFLIDRYLDQSDIKRYTKETGGYGIKYNEDSTAPLRRKHGSLLPKHIIRAEKKQRIAHCLEFSFLLIAHLRATGIEAYTKEEPEHAVVVAKLDKKMYQIDVVNMIFKEITESDVNTDTVSTLMHYVAKGVVLEDQRRFAEALESVNMAIEIDSDNSYAWNNLSNMLFDQGEFDEGMKAIDRAIECDPGNFKARYNKGTALFANGDFDEALELFNSVLETDPDNLPALNNKANTLFMLKRYDEALDIFKKVLESGHEYPAGILNNIAAIYAEKRELNKAMAICEKAIEIDPTFPNIWHTKARILQLQGKESEARRAQKRFGQLTTGR